MSKGQIPWARVFAEFLAILAGVTIALLADDWRDYRNDRSDERVALEEILRDLETDSLELAAQYGRMRVTERSSLWLLRHASGDPPVDSIIRRTSSLFFFNPYRQVSSGYGSLRDSGRLSIILDTELRRSIVEYFEVSQPYVKQYYDMYMLIYREWKESSAPHVRFVPPSTGNILIDGLEIRFTRSWGAMNADPEYINKIEEIGATASQFRINLETILARSGALRASIRRALE
jgi:hypothetical protein